jgi:hypothetical protein
VTNLMGEAAQQSFSRGWGVGLAVSQAAQFRDMFIVACQSALVLTVLETLWLVSNTPWVAEMIGAVPSCCSDAHLTPGSMSSSGAYQLRCHGRSSAARSHAPLGVHRLRKRHGILLHRSAHDVVGAHADLPGVLLDGCLIRHKFSALAGVAGHARLRDPLSVLVNEEKSKVQQIEREVAQKLRSPLPPGLTFVGAVRGELARPAGAAAAEAPAPPGGVCCDAQGAWRAGWGCGGDQGAPAGQVAGAPVGCGGAGADGGVQLASGRGVQAAGEGSGWRAAHSR